MKGSRNNFSFLKLHPSRVTENSDPKLTLIIDGLVMEDSSQSQSDAGFTRNFGSLNACNNEGKGCENEGKVSSGGDCCSVERKKPVVRVKARKNRIPEEIT